ncbi:hypothetical protein I7I48_00571 [Histoplasma ohiense]|nr:hypothetical protein I7I48_00571 [Histoplasma ohiense (nom. inval.)]
MKIMTFMYDSLHHDYLYVPPSRSPFMIWKCLLYENDINILFKLTPYIATKRSPNTGTRKTLGLKKILIK